VGTTAAQGKKRLLGKGGERGGKLCRKRKGKKGHAVVKNTLREGGNVVPCLAEEKKRGKRSGRKRGEGRLPIPNRVSKGKKKNFETWDALSIKTKEGKRKKPFEEKKRADLEKVPSSHRGKKEKSQAKPKKSTRSEKKRSR